MEDVNRAASISRIKLIVLVSARFLIGIVLVGALLFISAGTIKFWNAWLYLAALVIPMIFALIYLVIRDPALLEKRMNLKEKEQTQKRYVKISIIFVIISYIIPGLDYRYHWSSVPTWLVALSTVFMVSGYAMFMAVMRQNTYASRVIEIQENQRLIDTGLYSFVRHPMYLAASVLYFFSPLVLGSFCGVIPMAFLPLLLAYRIKNEEEVLVKGLQGYEDYRRRVKYRLIPLIW